MSVQSNVFKIKYRAIRLAMTSCLVAVVFLACAPSYIGLPFTREELLWELAQPQYDCYDIIHGKGDLPAEILEQISPATEYFPLDSCRICYVDTTDYAAHLGHLSPPWFPPRIKTCLYNDFLFVFARAGTSDIVFHAVQTVPLDTILKVIIFDSTLVDLPPGCYDRYYFRNQTLRAKSRDEVWDLGCN